MKSFVWSLIFALCLGLYVYGVDKSFNSTGLNFDGVTVYPAKKETIKKFNTLLNEDLIPEFQILKLNELYGGGSLEKVETITELTLYILGRWDRLIARVYAERPNTALPKRAEEFRKKFADAVENGVKMGGELVKGHPIYDTTVDMGGLYHSLGYNYGDDEVLVDPITILHRKIVLGIIKPDPQK